ncbi:MAG: hypothetical protein LBM73_00265 [Candidatus Nomurabacteria bacterium]|jgi:hypothetical protein|nr:hypothetical protein [Candidatus Nomurabacteria bacterium]
MSEADFNQSLKFHREKLRAQYQNYLAAFDADDRRRTSALSGLNQPADQILEIWQTQARPQIDAVEKLADSQKTLGELMKIFGFNGEQAAGALVYLIQLRRGEIVDEFIEEIGGEAAADELRKILSNGTDEVDDLLKRWADYLSALEAQTKYGLNLIDPQQSRHWRKKQARRIRRERRDTALGETRRLTEIGVEMQNLLNQNPLLGDLTRQNWSLVEVLDLRRQYLKKLDPQTAAAERLAIFDDITAKFQRRQLAAAAGSAKKSLKDLRADGRGVDQILLTIFDLDNAACNQLLRAEHNYAKLSNERANIHLAQTNLARDLANLGEN